MVSSMGSCYISERASIARSSLIGSNSYFYGNVKLGPGVIFGPNVIIGHPSPQEQANIRKLILSQSVYEQSLEDIFDRCVSAETSIEAGVVIRSGTIIYSGSLIQQNADIAHNCLIRENCCIGRDTHVVTGAQIMGSVTIGHGCRIAGTLCNRTQVGNCTSMLGHAMHRFRVGVPGYIEPSPKIGDGVIIGREAAIVGGVEIGDYAVIGAGTVVTKSIPSYSVWVGNPARWVEVQNPEDYRELKRRVEFYEDQKNSL